MVSFGITQHRAAHWTATGRFTEPLRPDGSSSAEHDVEFAQRLTREHGVAAIPISPFLNENEQPGPVVRFCFAKRDETLQKAAERLRDV